MTDFQIRPMEPADRDSIVAVIVESIPVAPAKSLSREEVVTDVVDSLDRWLDSTSIGFGRTCWGGGRIQGFVLLKDFWNLSHLFVRLEFQRQGIGSRLLSMAVEAATEARTETLRVNSAADAVEFYQRHSFEVMTGGPRLTHSVAMVRQIRNVKSVD